MTFLQVSKLMSIKMSRETMFLLIVGHIAIQTILKMIWCTTGVKNGQTKIYNKGYAWGVDNMRSL